MYFFNYGWISGVTNDSIRKIQIQICKTSTLLGNRSKEESVKSSISFSSKIQIWICFFDKNSSMTCTSHCCPYAKNIYIIIASTSPPTYQWCNKVVVMLIVEMDGWSHDCMSKKGSLLIMMLCVCDTSMFGCYVFWKQSIHEGGMIASSSIPDRQRKTCSSDWGWSLCLELRLQRLTACSLLLLHSWISSPEYNSQCPNRATRCKEKGRDETSLWETCIWNNGTGGITPIKLW